ncbi:hypothetical protein IQ249_22000 [Lusitaniella coriacea LEGE 07157]|uniref:Uncharacterized protein n=1 Tax=Lusitaniella coriacea LEGE 07157 TaxID=945747 RepID=A0A8J7DZM0_9CYAN|nr:hypothetical protein [Lusitaniella coriacea]MBE9118566.1 hypothetical protein [Lusitaniella coriacea LEGE 07157]
MKKDSECEQTLSIYPSSNLNQVCLIESNEEGFSRFASGTVLNNGEIRTSDRRFIICRENYLGIAGVYNGQPFVGGDIPLTNPRPLFVPSHTTLTTINESSEFENVVRQTLRQFKEAGCTASLPDSI